MLYQKPINDITWEDVEAFCEQSIPENTALDYKVDFPSDLPKVISSFANTFGGIVLIGVAEDEHNRPVTPIAGVENVANLTERVTSSSLSSITPPVIPEVQLCPNEAGDRVIIVVRVHQSHETPHAIAANTRVYTRVNNTSNPIKQADLEQVEWLSKNRQRSLDLRKSLCTRAFNRYCKYHKGFKPGTTAADPRPYGGLELWICPKFPKEEKLLPPALNIAYQDFRITNYRHFPNFPIPPYAQGQLSQEGIIIYDADAPDTNINHGKYTELSGFGSYYYIQKSYNELNAMEIFIRIAQFLDSAKLFLKRIEIQGPLHYEVRVYIRRDCPLRMFRYVTGGSYTTGDLYTSPDAFIEYEDTIQSVEKIDSDFVNILIKPVERIAWGFGITFSRGELDRLIAFERN